MIQFNLNNTIHTAFLDVADAINSTYRPLVQFKSQLTGKSKYFIPTIFQITKKDRYCVLYWFNNATEDLDSGIIYVGNTDFPFGFYDVTIYKNISDTNLDPTITTPVYHTILNLFNSTKSSSTFTQYTTNDTDTNSVYITF